ncbi:hypothetical protein N7450_000408 [Penicillium hetheringtonii]|uniref:DUF3824 domain-containing protein n=1 Tax=Penicillium hetheringtonii TaxID=911720 RepID=A0AAD6H1Q4_9EURO|nr:hypothetical protein N7450_000408 [Penicillium hetheringtonii]
MSYYDDRRYSAPRDRGRPASGYAADYFDDHPRSRHARDERENYPYYRDDGSLEEIPRDFPPGRDYYYERSYDSRRPRRPVQETVRRASSVSGDPYHDGGHYRRSRPQRSRRYDDRPPPRRSRYDSPSSSRSPPRHSRRKSISDAALGALGLGAASKASSDRSGDRYHGRGRGRSYSRHGRYSSDSRSRSRDRHRHGSKRDKSEQRMMQAARAALTAGAAEAFRSRKDPGEWTGAKGKRVLTAAVTAAGTDALVDKDPNKHGTRHVIESTLAGMATNHFINGGRSKSRGRNGRSSSAGGGLKNLAATGALAAAGKEIFDKVSRSRSRPRGSDDDRYSDDDDDRRGSKKRSKSVSDYINKGIAALGLDEGKDRSRDRSRSQSRSRSRDRDDRSDRRERRHHRDRDHRERDRDRDSRYGGYSDSDADSDYGRGYSRRGRGSRDVGRTRSLNSGRTPRPPTSAPRSAGPNGTTARGKLDNSESDSDLGDSSDEKKTEKKMKREMLLTSGLATVATIHAGHSVYGSVNKRKKRLEQVKSGEISLEEARRQRMKANALDVASIGLAALGIKGAYGEWKEVMEKRKETENFHNECIKRAMRRELKRNRSNSLPSYHRWPDEIEYAGDHGAGHGGNVTYHDGNPYGATTEAPAISY